VLEEKLIAEGLLTQEGLLEAGEHQKKFGCALEDSLIALRLVPEREVLRVLARAYRLQYLTLEKVKQIRVESELLERVPVRVAETCGVIPFRFDVDDVLWVITRGPLSADDREKLRVRSEARQVNLLLALPSVVGALIRRYYYSDLDSLEAVEKGEFRPPQEKAAGGGKAPPEDAQDIITLSRELKCPACGAPASLDDFQCNKCLLLLNPEAGGSDPRMEVSVVRALLSISESRPFLKIPDPPARDTSNEATRLVPAPLDKRLVPRLVAGLDLALKPMHQFEAYVASYIDGEHSIEELIARAKLPRAEVHALLHTFKARGLIQLDPPRAPPPPPLTPAQLAPLPTPLPVRPPLATTPPPPAPAHVPAPVLPSGPPPGYRPGPDRPERPTPIASPPAAAPRPPPPRTPAHGLPPAAAAPVPTPFPAGQAGGIRVFSRSEAQKVHDTSPPREPYSGPATPAPVRRTEADSVLANAVNLERRGDLDGAIYLLKKGISQLPQPGPLYNKLALILIHQRRDFRQAEELLHKALELEPENEVYEKNLYKIITLAALKASN
jgi:hypothetical protein